MRCFIPCCLTDFAGLEKGGVGYTRVMKRFGFGSGLVLLISTWFLLSACAAKKVRPGEYHPIPVEEQYRIFESLPEVTMIGFADSFYPVPGAWIRYARPKRVGL